PGPGGREQAGENLVDPQRGIEGEAGGGQERVFTESGEERGPPVVLVREHLEDPGDQEGEGESLAGDQGEEVAGNAATEQGDTRGRQDQARRGAGADRAKHARGGTEAVADRQGGPLRGRGCRERPARQDARGRKPEQNESPGRAARADERYQGEPAAERPGDGSDPSFVQPIGGV